MPATPPRSLADDLRARDDQALAALVAARPDLVHPVPADIAALATRAGSPSSIATALRGLDQLSLHVVLAAALAPDPIPTSALVAQVAEALVGGLPAREARTRVRAIVDRLRTQGLLWGTERAVHLVGGARDLLVPPDRGPRVAALDPTVAAYVRDPESLHGLVAAAPEGARAALDRLLGGPVIGTVVDARRPPDPQRSPVDWLLAHHLLIPLGTDRAVVPAEVAALLRDTGPPAVARLLPPAPTPPAPDPQRVEQGAVGAVLDVLHGLTELGIVWTDAPPARLRSGSIAQRDLTRTARAIGTSESTAALLVEVASAAGLLAPDAHEVVTVLPTPRFDAWRDGLPAERHADLMSAWLDMPRRVGPEARPLEPERAAPGLPDLRREVLAALATAPGGWTDDEVLDALVWWAPRRDDPTRGLWAREVLAELRTLGLLVSGTLTEAGRALAAGDRPGVVAALAAALPAQVDALVLQADLTAIVPGLPTPELDALMRLVADPESTGAASVYRFSDASVRRALDAGRSAAELLGDLGRRGPVPQPLAYLVQDVARRHAALRIGAASTYLRCDDPVVLAGILADPATAGLGLVALSETVLASAQAPEHVLESLRRLGHHPQPEAGLAPVSGPRRARGRPTIEPGASPVSPALAAAAVRAMRANDRGPAGGSAAVGAGGAGGGPRSRPEGGFGAGGGISGGPSALATRGGSAGGAEHPVPTATPAEVMAALRSAIAADAPVWIGYADPTGVAGDRRVEPLRLAGGYLTALDLRTEAIQSFAIARITGVQPA